MSGQNDRKQLSRRRFLQIAGGAAAGLAVGGIYEYDERNRISVERSTLLIPRWDAVGFKVALLTDLHIDSDRAESVALQAVHLAANEKPDVILMGGDLVSIHNKHTEGRIQRVMAAVHETGIPAYNVIGNHEYWAAYATQLVGHIRKAPVHTLFNQTRECDGVVIWGIDDGIAHRCDYQSLDARYDRNVIALFHEPDLVKNLPKRPSLMLAGHSHGGQVCTPWGSPMRLPGYGRQYVRGFYPEANVPIYVSRGVGVVGVPYRAFCPPEVSILTLHPA